MAVCVGSFNPLSADDWAADAYAEPEVDALYQALTRADLPACMDLMLHNPNAAARVRDPYGRTG